MHTSLHKETILKARLKTWLGEAYVVTRNIEGKLATLQVTQQQLQVDSAGEVTDKTIEDVK